MYLTPISEFWNPSGRINRLQYLIVLICLWIAIGIMASIVKDPEGVRVVFIIGGIMQIPSIIKRLHDFNYSGFWVLLIFLPAVNFILSLCLLIFAGTKGPNKYGIAPNAKYK